MKLLPLFPFKFMRSRSMSSETAHSFPARLPGQANSLPHPSDGAAFFVMGFSYSGFG